MKLSADDCTFDCQDAFDTLKQDLSRSVMQASPDFMKHLILAVGTSFDGTGAVLSQLLSLVKESQGQQNTVTSPVELPSSRAGISHFKVVHM